MILSAVGVAAGSVIFALGLFTFFFSRDFAAGISAGGVGMFVGAMIALASLP